MKLTNVLIVGESPYPQGIPGVEIVSHTPESRERAHIAFVKVPQLTPLEQLWLQSKLGMAHGLEVIFWTSRVQWCWMSAPSPSAERKLREKFPAELPECKELLTVCAELAREFQQDQEARSKQIETDEFQTLVAERNQPLVAWRLTERGPEILAAGESRIDVVHELFLLGKIDEYSIYVDHLFPRSHP